MSRRNAAQMQRVAISRPVHYATRPRTRDPEMFDFIAAAVTAATPAADLGILLTGLVLGIRHGIDWDHIAAITDITSTTASANMAEAAHAGQHVDMGGHQHAHGGPVEVRAHDAGPGGATAAPALAARPGLGPIRFMTGELEAIRLGTL